MTRKTGPIPVNNFGGEQNGGIVMERISFEDLPLLGEWSQPERHDRHSFFLLEKGAVTIEIDFKTHNVQSPSVIYMHPDQVHRVVGFESVTVFAWAIKNEQLHPEYRQLLENLAPADPLPLSETSFALMQATVSLALQLGDRKSNPLHQCLVRDSCNTLIALMLSLYMEKSGAQGPINRFETVTKAFRDLLEKRYLEYKRPADYARQLHLSAPYLNECVRNATGFSVSHHIQQRVILEAKRLLYHSGQSFKEIAAALGFDDYPYFSRLFTKITGSSPSAFRSKNRG